MEAYDGYATSKGIKKHSAAPVIPSEADRKALRARIDREARLKESNGDA